MNLTDAVGRLFLIGLPGKTLDTQTVRLLEEVRPGFIILFARNIESPEQVHELVGEVNRILPYKPVFAIDQEGGIVSRFREGFTVSPGAMALAATGKRANAEAAAQILAKEMRAVGMHWNLAPVVDINVNPNNPGIGVRSFGDDPENVTEFAAAFIDGMQQHGILTCLKHFPGLGRVDVDPHLDLPVLDLSEEELLKFDLIPFCRIRAESVMPSHIYLPKIQAKQEPASISTEVLTGLARQKLDYEGVLVADDLLMGGVTEYFAAEKATVQAFRAGMDVLAICHHPDLQSAAKDALLTAVESSPALQERLVESLRRVDVLRERALVAPEFPLDIVGNEKHREEMARITDESVTAILRDPQIIPLDFGLVKAVYSVRLSRMVQVEDAVEAGTSWVAKAVAEKSQARLVSFDARIAVDEACRLVSAAPEGGLIVLFTENAHLREGQTHLVEGLARRVGGLLLIALRNPYDSFIVGVENSLISYGYETISQQSLLKVLEGAITPTGRLPVGCLCERKCQC